MQTESKARAASSWKRRTASAATSYFYRQLDRTENDRLDNLGDSNPGLKATALGCAFTATADDGSALFYNAAGLSFQTGRSVARATVIAVTSRIPAELQPSHEARP